MRVLLTGIASMAVAIASITSVYAEDLLPSWNEGPTKKSITSFVEKVTKPGSSDFVPPAERIATFDQDGTLWVEQPMYPQVIFCLDHVPEMVAANPELKDVEPFKTVLSGDREAIAKLPESQLYKLDFSSFAGMTEDEFQAEVKKWIATSLHPRWKKHYDELTYKPMQELLRFLRANGFKTYIVTGGDLDFVRNFVERVYGIPPEQVVGTANATKYGYDFNGLPILSKESTQVISTNGPGKPEGINLMIGRRPVAAFGNSDGDKQMLEYAHAAKGKGLSMIVLHDDPKREYAYGPAHGQPNSKIGTFGQALYDEATKDGWTVISMKSDWKRVFAFEK